MSISLAISSGDFCRITSTSGDASSSIRGWECLRVGSAEL